MTTASSLSSFNPYVTSPPIQISPLSSLWADCAQIADRNISVVWRVDESIKTQVLSPDLQPLTPADTTSSSNLNYQPKNLALDNGGRIDLWFAIINGLWKIVFQQRDATNAKIGSITEVFPAVPNEQGNADVARLTDGRIVITCTVSEFDVAPNRKGPGIIYQVFSSTMDPIPAFKGNAYEPNHGDHDDSSLSPTPDGGFNITFSANGSILSQHISSSNIKDLPLLTITTIPYSYHPTTGNSVVAWARATTGDVISSYHFSALGSNQTFTFNTSAPSIPWSKIWTTFQSYLKVLPDSNGGFTLAARVNNTVVQQHFPSLQSPPGPITTIATSEDPFLQISGCSFDRGWITLVSNTSGLYAQTNTFVPTPAPSPSPTPHPTNMPTPFPTLPPTPQPTTPTTLVIASPYETSFIAVIAAMACILSVSACCFAYIRHRYNQAPYSHYDEL